MSLVASLMICYHYCAISFSPRKWTAFSQLHLQQDSMANVCTFKLWYGRGWQMKWTQLSGDGNRKRISSFELWDDRRECCASRTLKNYPLQLFWGMQIPSMQLQMLWAFLHCCMWPLPNWKLWQSKQHSSCRYWRGGWHSELNALKLILWTKMFVH